MRRARYARLRLTGGATLLRGFRPGGLLQAVALDGGLAQLVFLNLAPPAVPGCSPTERGHLRFAAPIAGAALILRFESSAGTAITRGFCPAYTFFEGGDRL